MELFYQQQAHLLAAAVFIAGGGMALGITNLAKAWQDFNSKMVDASQRAGIAVPRLPSRNGCKERHT